MAGLNRNPQGLGASLVFGSNFNAFPNARVAYTFAEIGSDVRVVVDMAMVTNPGSAFENTTPMNNNPESELFQEILNNIEQRRGA